MIQELLGIQGILVLLFEIYRGLRKYWLRLLLEQRKREKRTRKPAVQRPKSEKDCRFCREEKGKRAEAKREMPESWQSRKGRGGPKKKLQTEGFFCPNKSCEYYGIKDETNPCISGVWDAWKVRGDPGFQVPGMWEEVYSQTKYYSVSLAKSHRVG